MRTPIYPILGVVILLSGCGHDTSKFSPPSDLTILLPADYEVRYAQLTEVGVPNPGVPTIAQPSQPTPPTKKTAPVWKQPKIPLEMTEVVLANELAAELDTQRRVTEDLATKSEQMIVASSRLAEGAKRTISATEEAEKLLKQQTQMSAKLAHELREMRQQQPQ